MALNPLSCFPYAEVAVAVAQAHPPFAELMIARLHQVTHIGQYSTELEPIAKDIGHAFMSIAAVQSIFPQ